MYLRRVITTVGGFCGGLLIALLMIQVASALPPSCPPGLLTCGGASGRSGAVADSDRDGYTTAQGDCDDANFSRSPGRQEICSNGIDDDCDVAVDEIGCLGAGEPAVTDLNAQAGSVSSVALWWTAISMPTPVTQYDVRQSATLITSANWSSAQPLANVLASGSAGTVENYQVTGLSAQTTYYFAVKAVSQNGSSALSNVAIAVTMSSSETPSGTPTGGTPPPVDTTPPPADTVPPPPVTDLYAVPSYSGITLRWTSPVVTSDLAQVVLVRQVGAAPVDRSDGTPVFGGLAEEYVDTTVGGNATYYYAAYGCDASSNCALPAVVSGALLPLPSDGSVVTDPGGTVYVVENGVLRVIEGGTFQDLGLGPESVIALSNEQIARYGKGDPIVMSASEILKQIDPDHDGLSNYDEIGTRTEPSNPDTDFDSYFDGEEVATHHDPLTVPATRYVDKRLVSRMRGRILLQVERQGQAWWVNPADGKRYYLRDGNVAYQVMRYLSLGITNENLGKIPVAGTEEVGDPELVKRLSGRMLLSVEGLGEVWYVNPADGKRYYLRDGDAAYWVMRYRSLGIKNVDLDKIPIGSLRGKLTGNH